MQTATSETESKSLDLSICVHRYTLRAPCPQGQGTSQTSKGVDWSDATGVFVWSATWAPCRQWYAAGSAPTRHKNLSHSIIHLVFWSLSTTCLLQTASNFVESFDDVFRVSTPKITSRSVVHRPLSCGHLRRHRSGHTDTVRSGPFQIWSNAIRTWSQLEGLLDPDSKRQEINTRCSREHIQGSSMPAAPRIIKLKRGRQASRL